MRYTVLTTLTMIAPHSEGLQVTRPCQALYIYYLSSFSEQLWEVDSFFIVILDG